MSIIMLFATAFGTIVGYFVGGALAHCLLDYLDRRSQRKWESINEDSSDGRMSG